MKMLIKQTVIIVFLSVLLAACATTDGGSELGRDLDERGSDCISIRTIRDYTPLDNRSLLIEAAGKRNYYVTLVISSFELRSSHRLGFQSRDDWLCPYGGDQIVFDGFGEMPIGIRSITRLTPEQVEDLLIRHGKKEPEEQQDQAPTDLEGAEVEELGEVG